MTTIPLSSCGYIDQNKLCVYLPSNPTNGQNFVDADGNIWVYDGLSKSWVDTKRRRIPLADGTNVGLLSSELKNAIDDLDPSYGGFGFVVDRPYTKPVTGPIKLKSNSLNIEVLSASGNTISPSCLQSLALASIEDDVPEIRLSIKPEFMGNLTFYYPAPDGKVGDEGIKGPTGDYGSSSTPRGTKGQQGPNLTEIRKLVGIIVNDIDELSEESIAHIDTTNGIDPTINITRSSSPLSTNEPATSLIGLPISRTIVYQDSLTDGCDLSGLSDYTITRIGVDNLDLDVDILRLSDTKSETSTSHRQRLSQVVDSLIEKCELSLIEIDEKYAEIVKQYVERIDAIARNNLAALADQLNDCERRLETEDWSLSFKRCPTFSPSSALAASSVVGSNSVVDEEDGQDYIISL